MKTIRVLMTLVGLMVVLEASAWVAAIDGGARAYISAGHEHKWQAIHASTKDCIDGGGQGCNFLDAGNAMAVVVARGAKGAGHGMSDDPEVARREAIKGCAAVTKNCKVVQAIWDPGVRWAAVVQGTGGFFARVNADLEDDAVKGALATCRKHSKADCKVVGTTNLRTYVAMALADGTSGFEVHASQQGAEAGALAGCKKHAADPSQCSISDSVLNRSGEPAPASMAKIQAEAARNEAAVPRAPRPAPTQSTVRSRNYATCRNNVSVRPRPSLTARQRQAFTT